MRNLFSELLYIIENLTKYNTNKKHAKSMW